MASIHLTFTKPKGTVKLSRTSIYALTKLFVFRAVCTQESKISVKYTPLVKLNLATMTYERNRNRKVIAHCFKITPLGRKALRHVLSKNE